MQTQWDIKNAVSTEITPLEVLEDLLGKLTEKDGLYSKSEINFIRQAHKEVEEITRLKDEK